MARKGTTLDRDQLSDLYLKQYKTDAEIAALYGVSDVSICNLRRKFGIDTLTARIRSDALREGPRLESLTPTKLADLYASMGDRGIAKIYGVTKPTISLLRQKWGIKPLSKTERATSNVPLTEEQKEIVLGTLLGDAHLLERGVLRVAHYYGQYDYLISTHQSLIPHVLPIFYEESEKSNGKLTFAFGFRTVQHEWLRTLRSIFYPQGVKIFPASVIQTLTPRSLAYWYFDDGHLDSELPSFALGAISEEMLQQVVQWVSERFSLDTYASPESTESCRILRIRGCSADAFFELVREFASEDLLYKIPSKHWPQGVAAKWPLKTYEAALLSTNLVNETKAKLRDWASLEDAERANFIEAFAQFWEKAGFPYHVPRPEELLTLSRLEASSVIQSGTIKARQVGQAICQGISRHIWAAHSYDSSSPLELFASKLRDLIEYCLKMGQVPNAANLRSALRFWRHNGVYNFRPSAAKALVDRYCRPGGVVFDPCAGYGGRLLGTLMSSAKATYVACEPLVESYKALGRLTEWISSYVSGVEYRVKLINQPAEEAQFPEDADVVLTSPPYWKREVYGDENTQSAVRYSTYEQWLTEFWLTTLKKAILALRPSGWLLLNVDNFSLNKRDYLLIQDTIKIVQSLGLGKYETLKYDMSGEGQGEVVLCWAKHVSAEVFSESYTDGVRLPTCSVCGKTKALKELFLGICDGCQTLPPTVTCEGCDVEFAQTWKGKRFHSEACYAQYRRRLSREQNPIKKGRTFTCKNCSSTWSTEKPGNFTICPTCREAKKAAIRRKVCAYRNCGIEFTDLSLKNSSKYCCPEHRRREKLFRSGIAQDGSYFRDSKPVNGGSRSAKR